MRGFTPCLQSIPEFSACKRKALLSIEKLNAERAPTTGRVSSRCPHWFAPHTQQYYMPSFSACHPLLQKLLDGLAGG